MHHYESPGWKRLIEEVRPHTTGYCLRQHSGIDPTSKRGYHIEVWTNKHTIQPLMLTAWQQPNGEWYCQLWDGGPVDFDAQRKKQLEAQAEKLEREIESMDKDVEYLQRHGSGKEHAEARHKRHRAHQKLTDINRQLNEV